VEIMFFVLFCSSLLIYRSRSGSDTGVAESALASCIICGSVLESPFCCPAYSVDLALILALQNSFCFALEGLLAFLLVCYCRSISWCDFLHNFVSKFLQIGLVSCCLFLLLLDC
jgi:hypothetical protein